METFAPKGKIFGPILPQFILEKRITLGANMLLKKIIVGRPMPLLLLAFLAASAV